VLPRLAYITLRRSIQLLVLLARGDAAKDLEILVLRHQLTSSAARCHDPSWNPPTARCAPRSAERCHAPLVVLPRHPGPRCCAGIAAWSPACRPTPSRLRATTAG
jgi:hypothetical protein